MELGGSTPSLGIAMNRSIQKYVEADRPLHHGTHNPLVVGSIPTRSMVVIAVCEGDVSVLCSGTGHAFTPATCNSCVVGVGNDNRQAKYRL